MDVRFRRERSDDGHEWTIVDHEPTEATLSRLQSEITADAAHKTLASSDASSRLGDVDDALARRGPAEADASPASPRVASASPLVASVVCVIVVFFASLFAYAHLRITAPAPAVTQPAEPSAQPPAARTSATDERAQLQMGRAAVEFSLNHSGLLCAIDTRRFLVALAAVAIVIDVLRNLAGAPTRAPADDAVSQTRNQPRPRPPKAAGAVGATRKRDVSALDVPSKVLSLPTTDAHAQRQPRQKTAAPALAPAPAARRAQVVKILSPAPAGTPSSVFSSLAAASAQPSGSA
ncbi:hypothetical protein KFE25_010882 [Diacronema lutheri]|uniref:Uncharacterized protein n=1 Tax=Diacronema lutheri TaxID=2081491 RepID=A0A8J5XC31_DIALT|nr:hypothetical protein KFE25_010882 [Diacronema lutheri]